MKKLLLILMTTTVLSMFGCERVDVPVTFAQLPQKAQTFLNTHFPKVEVSYAIKDVEVAETTYDVVLVNNFKIEFDKNGEWLEVESKTNAVPQAIIPANIKNYVSKIYKNTSIFKIGKDRRGYDIKLNNGLELDFNSKGEVIEIDD